MVCAWCRYFSSEIGHFPAHKPQSASASSTKQTQDYSGLNGIFQHPYYAIPQWLSIKLPFWQWHFRPQIWTHTKFRVKGNEPNPNLDLDNNMNFILTQFLFYSTVHTYSKFTKLNSVKVIFLRYKTINNALAMWQWWTSTLQGFDKQSRFKSYQYWDQKTWRFDRDSN